MFVLCTASKRLITQFLKLFYTCHWLVAFPGYRELRVCFRKYSLTKQPDRASYPTQPHFRKNGAEITDLLASLAPRFDLCSKYLISTWWWTELPSKSFYLIKFGVFDHQNHIFYFCVRTLCIHMINDPCWFIGVKYITEFIDHFPPSETFNVFFFSGRQELTLFWEEDNFFLFVDRFSFFWLHCGILDSRITLYSQYMLTQDIIF